MKSLSISFSLWDALVLSAFVGFGVCLGASAFDAVDEILTRFWSWVWGRK